MELPIIQYQETYTLLVANDEGTIRVHMSFSLNKLTFCKQRLDQFSEDPSKFVEGFHVLRLVYDLTWKDVQVILSICLYP